MMQGVFGDLHKIDISAAVTDRVAFQDHNLSQHAEHTFLPYFFRHNDISPES
jgi:hypothetical protein